MREDGFSLLIGEREEEAGGEDGEDAGEESAEEDPDECGQSGWMLARP